MRMSYRGEIMGLLEELQALNQGELNDLLEASDLSKLDSKQLSEVEEALRAYEESNSNDDLDKLYSALWPALIKPLHEKSWQYTERETRQINKLCKLCKYHGVFAGRTCCDYLSKKKERRKCPAELCDKFVPKGNEPVERVAIVLDNYKTEEEKKINAYFAAGRQWSVEYEQRKAGKK